MLQIKVKIINKAFFNHLHNQAKANSVKIPTKNIPVRPKVIKKAWKITNCFKNVSNRLKNWAKKPLK